MPKPAHTRITFSGVWGSAAAPVEHWSFSLGFPASVLASTASDATADGLANTLASVYDANNMDGLFGSDVVLTEVRVAAIDGAGKTYTRADGTYVQGIALVTKPGTMAKQPVPLQQALCVSLVTGRPGPTGKGRFFLPWPAISLDADDKRIPVAQVNSTVTILQDFLNNMQNVLGAELQVVSSKGYMTDVTAIRVGRVPDTMRSRREDAVEGYVQGPLA